MTDIKEIASKILQDVTNVIEDTFGASILCSEIQNKNSASPELIKNGKQLIALADETLFAKEMYTEAASNFCMAFNNPAAADEKEFLGSWLKQLSRKLRNGEDISEEFYRERLAFHPNDFFSQYMLAQALYLAESRKEYGAETEPIDESKIAESVSIMDAAQPGIDTFLEPSKYSAFYLKKAEVLLTHARLKKEGNESDVAEKLLKEAEQNVHTAIAMDYVGAEDQTVDRIIKNAINFFGLDMFAKYLYVKDPSEYSALGDIYAERGDDEAAFYAYDLSCRLAIEKDTDTMYFCSKVANSYFYEAADIDTEKMEPSFTHPLYLRAYLYYHEKNYSAALVYFNEALDDIFKRRNAEYNNDLLGLHYLRGWCNFKLNRKDEALADLQFVQANAVKYDGKEFLKKAAISIGLLNGKYPNEEKVKESLEHISECGGWATVLDRPDISDLRALAMFSMWRDKKISPEKIISFLKETDVKQFENASIFKASEVVKILTDVVLLKQCGVEDIFDISKKISAYVQYHFQNNSELETTGVNSKAMVDLMEVLMEKASSQKTPSEAAKIYAAAHELIKASFDVFGIFNDSKLMHLQARSARKLATIVDKGHEQAYGSPVNLFQEAVSTLEKIVSYQDDLENAEEKTLIEYGLAMSEYAEDVIDISKEETGKWTELLNKAEDVFNVAKERFPDNPEAWLNWGWNEYYRAKGRREYSVSLERTKIVLKRLEEIPSATKEQLGEAIRILLWSANEKAYTEIKGSKFETANATINANNVLKHLKEAEQYIKGVKGKRDLLYAIHRTHYLMGRILSGDGSSHTKASLEHLEKAMRYVDEVEPLEREKGLILKTRGWVRFWQGRTPEAINYFKEAVSEFPKDKTGWIADARKGLLMALKQRTHEEDAPTEEKRNNVVDIIELAVAVFRSEKDPDPTYIENEILPDLLALAPFDLYNSENGKYRARFEAVIADLNDISRRFPLASIDLKAQIAIHKK